MKVIGYEDNNRVAIKKRYQDNDNDFCLNESLKKVVDSLMVSKPLWEFEIEQPYMGNRSTAITIKQDDEELGSVLWKYVGSEYKYYVTNDRIADQMSRRGGYSTKSADKALLKINKTFSRASLREKMDKMYETVNGQISGATRRKHYELRELRNAVDKHALAYVQTIVWPMFVEYMEKNDPTVYNTILKRDVVQDEMNHVHEIEKSFASGEALLVLREGSVYIVKSGEEFKAYHDSNLPEHVKLNLGMLKLVEDKTFIAGMGFRASDTMFVVMQEKEDGQV